MTLSAKLAFSQHGTTSTLQFCLQQVGELVAYGSEHVRVVGEQLFDEAGPLLRREREEARLNYGVDHLSRRPGRRLMRNKPEVCK